MRILKIENCPSLSGNSNLTYHVGCSDQGDICFRVFANTASGYFSKEWISMAHVEPLLSAAKITSGSFNQLYAGKSVNSSGFLLAVIINEGLVNTTEGKDRTCADQSKFLLAMKVLIDAGVNLDPEQKKTTKKKKSND